MNVRELLGFVLVPLMLFIVAGTFRGFGFTPASAFAGVGELGMLIAVSLLIVGGTCLVYQVPPGQLPVTGVMLVTVTCIVVASLGVTFRSLGLDSDLPQQFYRERWQEYPYSASLRTLLQFTLILAVLFAAPRLGKRQTGA